MIRDPAYLDLAKNDNVTEIATLLTVATYRIYCGTDALQGKSTSLTS
jgi:hypothetical protein